MDTITKRLIDLSEEKYQKFASSLVPTEKNILGVRLPALKAIAKEIMQKEEYAIFLQEAEETYFENIMLKGMIIGLIPKDIDLVLKLTQAFLPKIKNWSICDTFCAGLKITKKHKERVWDFLQEYAVSQEEYENRFVAVMLLQYYTDAVYAKPALQLLETMKNDGYYANMGIAWAISIFFIKQPEITFEFLKGCSLDTFTYKKALQKITESRQIDDSTRKIIQKMKKSC